MALLIQPEDSPPLIDRLLDHRIDTAAPLETLRYLLISCTLGFSWRSATTPLLRCTHTCRTADNRVCVVALRKATQGEHWGTLFKGDSEGARCVAPPYILTETEDDVILEMNLPFWIDASDVRVDVTETDLTIDVRNTVHLHRTYWRNRYHAPHCTLPPCHTWNLRTNRGGGLCCREEEQRRRDYQVVDVPSCVWSLDEDVDGAGERCRVLMVTLARPELTEDELMWKKGGDCWC
jgi:hypothetical protein